ncbi:hypothetical protein [Bizionia paragorgiae]|uniref:hypothetical protein n=1 Tax=Bizionia paragorgiae TaxID=283786 RepID=UPI003A92C6E2
MKRIKGLYQAETVSGSCCIDMRFMQRNNYIIRNKDTQGVLEWTRGDLVNFYCNMSGEDKYLQVKYRSTNRKGEYSILDYKIPIVEVASNLGSGTILYFLCPESGNRSRILISAYGEPKFINREYYETKHGLRIYYGCQKTSKSDYHNTRYFDIKRKVVKLELELKEKHRNTHYRGKPTKEQSYLRKLKSELNYHDLKRLQIFNEEYIKLYSQKNFRG